MATLHILSAGAAQAVVGNVIREFERETGHAVKAEFGAVGAMKARMQGGAPVDVIVLTAALIDELAASGEVIAGSRIDLGKVATGVAVRSGAALPDVSCSAALRASVLGASLVVCPDPAIATAGKIVVQMKERLGIAQEMGERLKYFPNGNTAMTWLSASTGAKELGRSSGRSTPHSACSSVRRRVSGWQPA